MSAASSPSEVHLAAEQLRRIRVSGSLDLAFADRDGITRAVRVGEADGYRARFTDATPYAEAILLNTGGGVAGGDKVHVACHLGANSDVVTTSVTAERIYRSSDVASAIDIEIALAAGARLAWLPQETILYSGSHLRRQIAVTMAPRSELTLLDVLVLGRRGSGEKMVSGMVADRWTVRHGGKLIHMEALRLDGAIEERLARAAVTGGANVVATLLHVAPGAGEQLERVRAAIAVATASLSDEFSTPEIAASAWGGKLIVRAIGRKLDALRAVFAAVCPVLTGRPMPRSWRL
ncbi:MAG: urease accessory protein UreD [Hyphomicrobiaceae bacterium]